MRLTALAAALMLLLPVASRAETCAEDQESCMENCHVDFGLLRERDKLTKCIKHCQDRFEDCQDLRQEERRSQVHLEKEKPPEERKHGGDPSDVTPVTEEHPTDVRPAPLDDSDDSGKKGKGRAAPPQDDPPQAKKDPPKKAEDDPPPPKKDPPPKKKQQDVPDSKKSEDDWSKER